MISQWDRSTGGFIDGHPADDLLEAWTEYYESIESGDSASETLEAGGFGSSIPIITNRGLPWWLDRSTLQERPATDPSTGPDQARLERPPHEMRQSPGPVTTLEATAIKFGKWLPDRIAQEEWGDCLEEIARRHSAALPPARWFWLARAAIGATANAVHYKVVQILMERRAS